MSTSTLASAYERHLTYAALAISASTAARIRRDIDACQRHADNAARCLERARNLRDATRDQSTDSVTAQPLPEPSPEWQARYDAYEPTTDGIDTEAWTDRY